MLGGFHLIAGSETTGGTGNAGRSDASAALDLEKSAPLIPGAASSGSFDLPAHRSDSLRELGYSLQANRKTKEGGSHMDRDAQFHYINDQAKAFLTAGEPVISVDTKKKE